jgi:hypothetical protein
MYNIFFNYLGNEYSIGVVCSLIILMGILLIIFYFTNKTHSIVKANEIVPSSDINVPRDKINQIGFYTYIIKVL